MKCLSLLLSVLSIFKDVPYNELSFDKRKDVLVAFRLLEREANGDITILWKMLSQEDAPILKNE